MDFRQFIEWGFLGLIGGSVTWAASVLTQINKNIGELNNQISSILEKLSWHEKEIERHGLRLSDLERHERK